MYFGHNLIPRSHASRALASAPEGGGRARWQPLTDLEEERCLALVTPWWAGGGLWRGQNWPGCPGRKVALDVLTS